MKRKTLVLLSSIMASAFLVGGAFAAYAVTDLADPFGINVTPGDVSEDETDYVTLKWGESTNLKNVGKLQVGENRKVGVVSLVSSDATYEGKFTLSIEDRTPAEILAQKEEGDPYLLDYLNVYLYEGSKDLVDGNLPAGEPVKTITTASAKTDGVKKFVLDTVGSAAGKEFTVFVKLDTSALAVNTQIAKDNVWLEVDWAPASDGDLATDNLVYFTKPSAWGAAYAYAWKTVDEVTTQNAAWPGVEMVNVYDDLYRISIPSGLTNIVFNAGDNNDEHKTADLTFSGYSADKPYWNGSAWSEEIPEKIEISVTATVNGQAVVVEDIKGQGSTDKGQYEFVLAKGDVIALKDGDEDLYFYNWVEATELEEAHSEKADKTYTAPSGGILTIYYNDMGELWANLKVTEFIKAPGGVWDDKVSILFVRNTANKTEEEYMAQNVSLAAGDLLYGQIGDSYLHWNEVELAEGLEAKITYEGENIKVADGGAGAYDFYATASKVYIQAHTA